MKKYDRSEIMKNAWDIFKSKLRTTFSEALKLAWENAKRAIKIFAKKVYVKEHITIEFIEKWVLRKMEQVDFMALDSGMAVDDIILERETEKAIQISTEWNGYRKLIWLPKSACKYAF